MILVLLFEGLGFYRCVCVCLHTQPFVIIHVCYGRYKAALYRAIVFSRLSPCFVR